MERRTLLTLLGAGALSAGGIGGFLISRTPGDSGSMTAQTQTLDTWNGPRLLGLPQSDGPYEIVLTEAEWRERLSANQFLILREEKTEKSGTSPLDKLYDPGTYHCAGCDLPVYGHEAKFDSRTGWPSFFQALPDAIRVKEDRSLFSLRTEVHCRRCGGHFGHVFADGPEPTGLRHCLNGLALNFVAA